MKDSPRRKAFLEALQLMSGQKVTVYTPVALVCLKEASQQQLSPRFHSAFILCCNYSRGLGALWALSGGATPSAVSASVLNTVSPRCAHYTFKRKRPWCTSKILSEFAIMIQQYRWETLNLFNAVFVFKYSQPVTIWACNSRNASFKGISISTTTLKPVSTTNPHF